jgi:hypothetical protein
MVDRYTKAVLTLIALCLVVIAAHLISVPSAYATQNTTESVDIATVGDRRVRVVHIGGEESRAIPVYVVNQP